ncbi:MAG: sulfatase, partial [Planctomycetes bacterium]|nr:sulfatase [Planctomycetota bacterium]
DQRDRVVLPNCDDSDSKTLLMEAGWTEQPRPKEMLFDLVFDPNETNNLVGRPHAQEALDEMRRRLDAHLRETDDPLLHGAVPLPPGAVLNTVDQLSPQEPTVSRQP